MTHQISLPPPLTYYGAFEFKQRLQRFTVIGLTLAVIVYGVLLSTYWLSCYVGNVKKPSIIQKIDRVIDLTNQPLSIGEKSILIPPISTTSQPGRGIPVPVPAVEVDPEQTIATQKEMSKEGKDSAGINEKSSSKIPDDLIIDDAPREPWEGIEKLPILVRRINPQYPEIARALGIEGRVWAKVWIDKEGKIRQVIIIKSDSEVFSRAVTEAVQQWIYTPAFMSNGPVAVWVVLPFIFKLNK